MYEIAQEKTQGEKESLVTITGGKQKEYDSVDRSCPSYSANYRSE